MRLTKCKTGFVALFAGCCALAATMSGASAATYYVTTGGTDSSTRDGSSGQPWKTIRYAATRVTTSGNTIKLGAGTFSETARIDLSPGVNLEGSGQSGSSVTTITTSVAATSTSTNTVEHLIYLSSPADVITAGNQTLSNFALDGKLHTVRNGISISRRSNVKVFNISARDCYQRAIVASGLSVTETWPAQPAGSKFLGGIEIYNSSFYNSALVPVDSTNGKTQSWGYGAICLYRVSDSSIHHNYFDENGSGGGGGFNLKGEWGRRLKVYNNEFKQREWWPATTAGRGRSKGYGFEYWFIDDSEVYNNTTNGGYSLFGNNSIFRNNSCIIPADEGKNAAFEVEGSNTRLLSNYAEGSNPGIVVRSSRNMTSFWIAHNVVRGCTPGIVINQEWGATHSGLFIYNNTVDLSPGAGGYGGAIGVKIHQDAAGSINNLQIRNNIITNAGTAAIGLIDSAGAVSFSSVQITHNQFYGNSTNGISLNPTTIGLTQNNNNTGDPLYVGGAVPSPYYRLQSTSPCIATGVNVNLTYLDTAPDRGAFVQSTSSGARIEAETNYSVVNDVDSNTIAVGNLNLDSYRSVGINDIGDTIKVHFDAPTTKSYTVKVRVRSGGTSNASGYFNGGYTVKLDDGSTLSLTGDMSSVSALDTAGGGVYWGTLQGTHTIPAGLHSLTIQGNFGWGRVDYIELS